MKRKFIGRGKRRKFRKRRRGTQRSSHKHVQRKAKMMTNPKSVMGRMLRSCVIRCAHPQLLIREQILGTASGATGTPTIFVNTNTHYTVNMTEFLQRQVFNSCTTVDSTGKQIYRSPFTDPKAFVHNVQFSLNVTNRLSGGGIYANELKVRVFQYYLPSNYFSTQAADLNKNIRSQWQTADPITGTVINPGTSALYNGQQFGAGAAYIGDWGPLSEAPFNLDIMKFKPIVRTYIIRRSASSTAGYRTNTVHLNWTLERVCKPGMSQVKLYDDVEADFTGTNQAPPALGDIGYAVGGEIAYDQALDEPAGVPAENINASSPVTYTRMVTIVFDDKAVSLNNATGLVQQLAVGTLQAYATCRLRPYV